MYLMLLTSEEHLPHLHENPPLTLPENNKCASISNRGQSKEDVAVGMNDGQPKEDVAVGMNDGQPKVVWLMSFPNR